MRLGTGDAVGVGEVTAIGLLCDVASHAPAPPASTTASASTASHQRRTPTSAP